MRRLALALASTLLLTASTACRKDPPVPKPQPAIAASGADAGPEAGAQIEAKVLAAADEARGTPKGTASAHDELVAGARGDELWAATYVYAADGDDPKLLAPLLKNDDATIRVLAAGGLVRLGDPAAFKVLVAEAGNAAMFAGSEPPQAVGEVAALMLSMATGEKLPVDATPATKAAWTAWYGAHGDKLTFDARSGWSAP